MNTELKDLNDVKDTLKEIIKFLELSENADTDTTEETNLYPYKERTLDRLIIQLRNIYSKVTILVFDNYKQANMREWLWKYRKTPLWSLLRGLPYIGKMTLLLRMRKRTL